MKYLKLIIRKLLPNYAISFLRKLRNGNYWFFLWLLPVKKNKIAVSNYFGKGYGDSAKYLVNKLLETGIELDVVWFLKKGIKRSSNFPDSIRTVKYASFRSLYEMATAKIWIDNTRKVLSPPKRKNQFYIQTWHSPLRLKTIEKDAEDKLSDSYIERAKTDSGNCDLMIAGCDFSFNIYRKSFWYDGKIEKWGTPRCDLFFDSNSKYKYKVCKYLNISSNINLILYAPTFRTNLKGEVSTPNFSQITNAAEKKFGGKWKLILRLHPNISSLSSSIKYTDICLDGSSYDDMQELLSASEILITDYSSCMFDMGIAGKKCFIYSRDLDDYLTSERQLYFNVKELPFNFSGTEEELVSNIMNYDENEYLKKLEVFNKKINLYEDGKASEKLAARIMKNIDNG